MEASPAFRSAAQQVQHRDSTVQQIANEQRAMLLPADSLPKNYASMPFIMRSRGLDTSGKWIKYGTSMLKFYIRTDGLYKISLAWLKSCGIDSSQIDPKKLGIYRKGVQVPLYASGMDDGRMDNTDYFAFVGWANRDSSNYRTIPADVKTPYPQYRDKYSDSAAYYLVLDEPSPSRIVSRVWIGQIPADTLSWYNHVEHVEDEASIFYLSTATDRNLDPDWTMADTWIMNSMNPGNSFNKTFRMDNLISTRPVNVIYRVGSLQGSPSVTPNHRVRAKVNSVKTAVDSITFNTGQIVNFGFNVPGTRFHNGTDTIRIESVNVQTGYSSLFLDWFDVEYSRNLAATDQRLSFRVLKDIPKGAKTISIKGFIADQCIESFRINKGEIIHLHSDWFNKSQNIYMIADSVIDSAQYFISSCDSMYVPPVGTFIQEVNIRSVNPESDYLMLSAQENRPAADEYCRTIESTYGITARAVTVEQLYEAYSFGDFNPEVIKLYLFDVLRTAKTRKPTYLVLAGDANSDFKARSGQYRRTFVPTYGMPISDLWFACFDSLSIRQSLLVGRIPIRTDADLLDYLDRHMKYLELKPDLWSKSMILFSGGEYYENDSELQYYRDINNNIIDRSVILQPFGGHAEHFYKTAVPPTNFGPYTPEYVQSALDAGSLAISFVGHSSTSLWDNSISTPEQLFNKQNVSPLITDFGCASATFGIADMQSFGERCLLSSGAQAIAYIGNTSFGYKAPMTVLPDIFYRTLLHDRYIRLGDAHAEARSRLYTTYGKSQSQINSVSMTTLLGDPIIPLLLPGKPDAAVKTAWIHQDDDIFTDSMDSLRFSLYLTNLGAAVTDTLTIRVEDRDTTSSVWSRSFSRPLPYFRDTVRFSIPGRGITGSRTLTVILDAFNHLDEIDKTNNTASLPYTVYSTSGLIANADEGFLSNGWRNTALLNPMFSPGDIRTVTYSFSSDASMSAPVTKTVDYGKTVTRLESLPALTGNARIWWTANLDIQGSRIIGPYKSWTGLLHAPFTQQDSLSLAESTVESGTIGPSGVSLLPPSKQITAVSAGLMDGNMGSVSVNGRCVFQSINFSGYGVAVFDAVTMKLKEQRIFSTTVSDEEADSLNSFLLRARTGELIVAVASSDPAQRKPRFVNGFHSIGALLIDSAGTQSSYVCIGKPGLAQGQAREVWKKKLQGTAVIDTSLAAEPDTVRITSPVIGPAARWSTLRVSTSGGTGATVHINVHGVDAAGRDTLLAALGRIDSLDLSFINAERFPGIKLSSQLIPGGAVSTRLVSWSVDYLHLPELALNYQSAYLDNDTTDINTQINAHLGIINAGEYPASSFPVAVDIVTPDNKRRTISTFVASPLDPGAWYDTTLSFTPAISYGMHWVVFRINDPVTIREQFTNNNVFTLPIILRPDSTRPLLEVFLDGNPPYDGDYVRSTPDLLLKLSQVKSPVVNQDRFILKLDDTLITAGDTRVTFTPATGSEPAQLLFKPDLAEGEHRLTINARTNSDVYALDNDLVIRLLVSSSFSLQQVTNYPNPFSVSTAFTWISTGSAPPQELKVKIYTAAGRLIRTIDADPADLRIGFNSMQWDGMDQDGDRLANGVYFYKVIARGQGGQSEYIGKLSVLR
jgi:hypothetical protein